LSEILPTVAAKKVAKGGFMVLRPDSGDPVQTVVLGLRAAERVFGCDINSKGFKVPRGCSVIQGALPRTLTLFSSSVTD
jgi:nicotinamide phosphoribosyltransferase